MSSLPAPASHQRKQSAAAHFRTPFADTASLTVNGGPELQRSDFAFGIGGTAGSTSTIVYGLELDGVYFARSESALRLSGGMRNSSTKNMRSRA